MTLINFKRPSFEPIRFRFTDLPKNGETHALLIQPSHLVQYYIEGSTRPGICGEDALFSFVMRSNKLESACVCRVHPGIYGSSVISDSTLSSCLLIYLFCKLDLLCKLD